ncbi:MAG TPA: hypothetical protein VKX46_20375 [Ktedonobacteraceae bacterium]|nr:hypothetical protein [Ktedonobacteraceae bacterium]
MTPTTTPDLCKSAVPAAGQGTIQVTTSPACTQVTSQFASGITLSDNTLAYPWANNNLAAVNNVKGLIKNGIHYQNTPIMGWGLDDPWPDPNSAEPTAWSGLDARLRLAVDTGATPVLTLSEAPWWMKGQLQGDGSTTVLTQADEWGRIAYESRILDNKMDAWCHLVQRIAERYMVAPYNVRYFQVWNELKGYYDPRINNYNYTTNAGDPSGPNAKHGYTYMYNRVYETLMETASSLGIDRSTIKVGGPYVFMDTWSSSNQSNPSNVVKRYGVFDQRPFDVVQYWLQHKVGAGFVTIDGSIENRDTQKLLSDPFTVSEIFGDVVTWIRSLDDSLYPGAKTLPIWFAEWFASPHLDTSGEDYDNAVKTYAMIKFIKAGGATALSWNNVGDNWADKGLWTTTYAGGGQPRPWYTSYKALNDFFAAGTPILKTIVSDPARVEALATAHKVVLVNKTDASLTVAVNGNSVSLAPYQVSFIDVTSK